MAVRKNIICCLLLLGVLFQACEKKDSAKEINDYFIQAKFKGDFFKTFDVRKVDTVVFHIRKEIPSKWWGIACEGAYYNLTNQYNGVSDSAQFELLTKLEQNFPSDSFHVFTQMIRGEISIKSLKYDSAFVYLTNAYNLSVKNKHYLRAADIQSNFAELALRQNDYPEATKKILDYHSRVIKLGKEEDRGRVFQSYKLLVKVYERVLNFQESHYWCKQAWLFALSDNASRRQYYSMEAANMLAKSYIRLKMPDSAQIMQDSARYFQLRYKSFYDKADWKLLQAQIYTQKGECAKALPLLYEAKEMQLDTDIERIAYYNKEIAQTHLCKNNLDSAIFYYKQTLNTPDTFRLVKIWDDLAQIYAQRKDFSSAYFAAETSKKLSKRVFSRDKEQAIGRLQLKNEMEKRELLLIEKENKGKINRLILLAIVFGLSFLLVLGIFWTFRKRKIWQLTEQKQQILQQEKELLLQEKELNEVKISLHERELLLVKQNLSHKEEELLQSIRLLEVRNMLIQELEMKLTSKQDLGDSEEKLNNLKILTGDDWRKFKALFEQLFPQFLENLLLIFPNLTSSETRLLLLLKLGFEANEIANILGISVNSVYKSRYRLRKKLNIEEGIELEQFIIELEA